MACCAHCVDADALFSDRLARRDLRRFRRRGPEAPTRALLDLLPPRAAEGASLLDVGGGVGPVLHTLFQRGLASATHVDASRGYLAAARDEAERRGTAGRLTSVYGDAAALALPDADLVTLDRVVCCYPDLDALVAATAPRARRFYGLVYPRDHLGMALVMGAVNLFERVQGRAFRTVLRPSDEVDAAVARHGLCVVGRARTPGWHAVLYAPA